MALVCVRGTGNVGHGVEEHGENLPAVVSGVSSRRCGRVGADWLVGQERY